MGSLFSSPTKEPDLAPKSRPLKKVIFIGPLKVGKSSLLARFAHDVFTDDIPPTQGVDLVQVNLPYYEDTRLRIWDCCGKERYWYLVPTFTRDARVVVAVYDVTSRASFEEVLCRIKSHAELVRNPEQTRYVLVGNKVDREEMREVEREIGEDVATRMGYEFLETSAKGGMGVKELFETAGKIVAGDDVEGSQSAIEL
ncbi:P-loop containing nucleoside triphosphate hydrolase protein [Aspergillus heterothallicus]